MKAQHANPEEAVLMAEDLDAKRSFGMHWGTFPLTSEFFLEPREKLKEELSKRGKPVSNYFDTMNHGETLIL